MENIHVLSQIMAVKPTNRFTVWIVRRVIWDRDSDKIYIPDYSFAIT